MVHVRQLEIFFRRGRKRVPLHNAEEPFITKANQVAKKQGNPYPGKISNVQVVEILGRDMASDFFYFLSVDRECLGFEPPAPKTYF